MQCFQCGTAIGQGSQFCNNCGKTVRQSQKNKTNLYIVLGILGGIFLMCFSCGLIGAIQEKMNPQKHIEKTAPVAEKSPNSKATQTPTAKATINLVDLAGKSVEEVQSVIGQPETITKKENTSNSEEFIEGEERIYRLTEPKKSKLEIFFYKGKSVELRLTGLTYWDTTNTAEELAERYGFTGIGNMSADKSLLSKVKWTGDFGKVNFREIEVSKSGSSYFDSLKAVVFNNEIVELEEKAKKKVEEAETKKKAENENRSEKPNTTVKTENKSRSTPRTLKSSSSSNGYIRGPRGGCYYITSGGSKRYVDRSLCN